MWESNLNYAALISDRTEVNIVSPPCTGLMKSQFSETTELVISV